VLLSVSHQGSQRSLPLCDTNSSILPFWTHTETRVWTSLEPSGNFRTVAYLDQLSVTRSRPSTDGHRTSDASDAGMAIATPDTNPHCMNSMAATWKLSFAYRHQPHCRARDDLGRYSSTAGFEITLSQNACRVRPVALVTRPAVFPGIPLFSHEPGPGRHCSQLAVFDLAGLRESESRSRLPGITCTCLLQTTHLA